MDVVVITGPPGAGKPTVAELVAGRVEPSACLSGDQFFGFLRQGYVDPWLVEAADQNTAVTEAAARATGRLVQRYHVVYDGVLDRGTRSVRRASASAAIAGEEPGHLGGEVARCEGVDPDPTGHHHARGQNRARMEA